MENKIQISHIPKVQPVSKELLFGMANKTYERLNERFPGELIMDIHFRETKKTGNREQIEAKVKTVVGGIVLNATFKEWSADKALKLCLAAISKEAQRKKRR